jgi:hypothetical protein
MRQAWVIFRRYQGEGGSAGVESVERAWLPSENAASLEILRSLNVWHFLGK